MDFGFLSCKLVLLRSDAYEAIARYAKIRRCFNLRLLFLMCHHLSQAGFVSKYIYIYTYMI